MKNLLLLIACFLTVAGCIKEKKEEKGEVSFPVSLFVEKDNSSQVKTSLNDNHFNWSDSDVIGLYVGSLQSNVRMRHTAGNEFLGFFVHVQDAAVEDVPFCAYYPYSPSVEGGVVSMEISSGQTAPFDSDNDYMVSSVSYGTYDEANMVIPDLTMDRHLCALAKIRIKCANAAYSTYKLKSVTLSSAKTNLCGEITFDVRDGTCSFSGTGKSIVLTYPEDARPALGSGSIELNAVLIPCSVDDLSVTLTTDHGSATISSSTLVNYLANRMVLLPIISSFTLEGAPDPEDDRIPCVFMGDSITQFWASRRTFFADNDFVGKGISGQWTSHMRSRFKQDVVDLNPKAVLIHGGTNDIGHPYDYPQHGYPEPDDNVILDNIARMAQMAIDAGIHPILTTIAPNGKNRNAAIHPHIAATNELIRQYALEHSITLVDFFNLLADEDGYLPKKYSGDGLHPNSDGYAVMEDACLPVINHVISQ